MSSERTRLMLYEDMKGIVRVESADELMGSLPPVGWGEVATKADLSVIRFEMAELRGDLRAEMAELRGDLRAGMAELRGDLRAGMADLRTDLQRWTITTMLAMTGVFGAIVFGAVKLSG